jgi:hypothetical protein
MIFVMNAPIDLHLFFIEFMNYKNWFLPDFYLT